MRVTQKKNHTKARKTPHFLVEAGVIGVLALLVVYVGIQKTSGHISPEVGFTDTAPDGLAILPASGASSPCPATLPSTDGSGAGGYYANAYRLANAVSQAMVDNNYNTSGINDKYGSNSIVFCITNGGSYYYFVPASTTNEINSFYNAAQAGLPGVTVSAP